MCHPLTFPIFSDMVDPFLHLTIPDSIILILLLYWLTCYVLIFPFPSPNNVLIPFLIPFTCIASWV
ncbi:hypothetical protein BJX68DRAFT_240364 [Aspergillus pseudodeflectus]|uniref:Uncharacterized protein n=1 Tax=Aspergillus pseudodeflectus TaxID=176178 RepID=A0ABR4K3E3_9EURO